MSSSSTFLADAASIAIAGGGLLALLGWGIRNAWKGLHRWARFLDDYEGTPARPGVAARPGVMARLESQDQMLAELSNQGRRTSEQVEAIADEMPKNGVPLAHKIDALWVQYVANQHQEEGPA
jgi:hypothetical protein